MHTDKTILANLPTFFRSSNGKKPDIETIKTYIENLKDGKNI